MMKIIAVGDVSFAGNLPEIDIEKSSRNIEKIMNDGDIVFCNLESPFTSAVKKSSFHYSKILNDSNCVFIKSSPICREYLKLYHFNVVSLANNHIMDFSIQGLDDTIENLRKVNINYVGAGKNIKEASSPYLFKKNGVVIGLLAFSYTYEAMDKYPGCAPIYHKSILHNISELKTKCDIIIISLHFGEEFSSIPNKSEIDFCHSIINSGANIILGHHPHVIRTIENYNGGIIAYSLGSFIFNPKFYVYDDRERIDDTLRKSIILQIDINSDKSLEYSTYPVRLDDHGLPELASEITSEIAIEKNAIHQTDNFNKLSKMTINSLGIQKKVRQMNILMKIVAFSIIQRKFRNFLLLIKRVFWRHL